MNRQDLERFLGGLHQMRVSAVVGGISNKITIELAPSDFAILIHALRRNEDLYSPSFRSFNTGPRNTTDFDFVEIAGVIIQTVAPGGRGGNGGRGGPMFKPSPGGWIP